MRDESDCNVACSITPSPPPGDRCETYLDSCSPLASSHCPPPQGLTTGRSGAVPGGTPGLRSVPAFGEQGIAEMGSQETGATGDQGALWAHALVMPFFIAVLETAEFETASFRAAGRSRLPT